MDKATALQDSGFTKIDKTDISGTYTCRYCSGDRGTQPAIRDELGSWGDDH